MKPRLMMVWHIFEKDVRLLWPFILGAAGIQFAFAGVRYMLDHGPVADAEALYTLYELLLPATVLSAGLLIATAVHQDAVPGVRQDWLVRPVRRTDLLLAKLLFVLVMAQGPILLADTFQALANGFPLGQSLASAATRGLLLLGFLSLPVAAFASLTRNLTEGIIGAVLVSVGIGVSEQLLAISRSLQPTTTRTGLQWIALLSVTAVLWLGATIILTLQYFKRETTLSRWITVGILALAFSARFIPWHFAFGLEQRLSTVPGAGRPIVPTYEPRLGKFRLPEGMGPGSGEQASIVYLPTHFIGLPDDGVVNVDRSQVRLLAADGKVLYTGGGDALLIRKEGHQGPVHFTMGSPDLRFVREIKTNDLSVPQDGEAWIYQGIAFPRGLYAHIKDQPLRLTIDYSLTLLQGNLSTIPALGAVQVLPDLGRCTTEMDDEGDDIQLHCMQAGHAPSCASAFLEHVPSGRKNPTAFSCSPNYAPFLVQFVPDGISRFGGEIRFHDLSGLAKYPVDVSELPKSRLVIRDYQAQDHFTRRLIIPEIRLSDWESVEHNQVAENR